MKIKAKAIISVPLEVELEINVPTEEGETAEQAAAKWAEKPAVGRFEYAELGHYAGDLNVNGKKGLFTIVKEKLPQVEKVVIQSAEEIPWVKCWYYNEHKNLVFAGERPADRNYVVIDGREYKPYATYAEALDHGIAWMSGMINDNAGIQQKATLRRQAWEKAREKLIEQKASLDQNL